MRAEEVRLAATAAALLLALFVLIGSGTTGSGDAMVRYRMATTFLATGDIALDRHYSQAVIGRGGRIYPTYGIGQAVIFAGPELAVQAVRGAVGAADSAFWEDVSIGLASMVLLPAISAAGLFFFCLILFELGFGTRTALLVTLLVGVGSVLLPYAKFHQEENQIAAIVFACAYFALRFAGRGRALDGVVAALLCWLPMWFRPTGIVESVPLAGLLLYAIWRASDRRTQVIVLAALTLTASCTAGWLLFYNWYRFGSAFETGYQMQYRENGFDQGSVVQGLLGPFLHPSKSILLYSPLLLLSVAGMREAWRDSRSRALLLAALSILALSILLPSRYKMWGGDTSWGPRYQIASHALLLVFSAYTLSRWSGMATVRRAAVVAVITLAIGMQLLALPFNFNLEYHLGAEPTWNYATLGQWYDLSKWQVPLRVESLVRYRDVWLQLPPRHPADAVAEYSIPAFLPWKLGQHFGRGVWHLALLIWLGGAVLWGVFALRFIRGLWKSRDATGGP